MSSRVTISATAIVFSSAVMVFAQASNPTQTFVNTAAQGGEAEVSLARTAETHTTNPQVKALASKIRDDHEKANAELKDLCERKHMTCSTMVSKNDEVRSEKLDKLSGTAFDRAYTDEMVKDHQADIKEFEKHQHDPDPDVAAWVTKTLPTLREHLKMAQDAQRAVGGK